MKHKVLYLFLVLLVFASITLATEDPALIAFRNCLQTNGPTECTLAPKTGGYTVESAINVTNTSLQSIRGTGLTPPDTTLRRGNTSMLSIMSVFVPGVTITDLQFDGNKSLFPPNHCSWWACGSCTLRSQHHSALGPFHQRYPLRSSPYQFRKRRDC